MTKFSYIGFEFRSPVWKSCVSLCRPSTPTYSWKNLRVLVVGAHVIFTAATRHCQTVKRTRWSFFAALTNDIKCISQDSLLLFLTYVITKKGTPPAKILQSVGFGVQQTDLVPAQPQSMSEQSWWQGLISKGTEQCRIFSSVGYDDRTVGNHLLLCWSLINLILNNMYSLNLFCCFCFAETRIWSSCWQQ